MNGAEPAIPFFAGLLIGCGHRIHGGTVTPEVAAEHAAGNDPAPIARDWDSGEADATGPEEA